MSGEAFTLQCHRCAGYFRAAAAARSRVRCPHCEWVALVAEFRQVGEGELPPSPAVPPPDPATAEAWEIKGKYLQFGCPHCERPMRMATGSAGGLADCPHCGLEIVSPDPATGSAARLSDASRRGLGVSADFKPRQLRAGGMRFPPPPGDEPGAGAPEGDAPGDGGHFPNPFDPAPAEVATPVRMLGIEALGAAFKARDALDAPQAYGWDAQAPSPTPAPERAPQEEPLPHDRRGRVFAFAAILFLGALGGMFMVLEMRRGDVPAEAPRLPVSERAAAAATDEARHAAAFAVAQRAVGASAWRGMAPLVRSRDRVEGLMAEYYRGHDFEPVVLVGFEDAVSIDASGTSYVQLRAETAGGERRLVGIEETTDGRFLFDWELWVDIARVEWHDFVETRPSRPQVLRVTITRNSPQARYLDDSGLGRDAARGVRLWLDNKTEPLFAILALDDPATAAVWEEISWDLGRRVVAEISFPPGASEADRVHIHRIIQPRWLRP